MMVSSLKGELLALFFCCILLSGCGGECKKTLDCPVKECFEAGCVDKTCEYDPTPNCCGNEVCDTGENKCTCSADCGVCSGKSKDFQYLTNFCDKDDECVFGIDEKSVKTHSLNSGILKSDVGTIEIDSTFNQPFNVKQDVLKIKITLKEKDDDASSIRITKIALIGENQKRQKVTLGEMIVSRPLWKNGDVIIEDLVLTPKTSDKESELKNAQLDITFSYEDADDVEVMQDSVSYKYPSLAFVYAQPDTKASCPDKDGWDDGNPGTDDACSASTSYFVTHSPISGACGNFKCDDSETRCTCPADCGPCSGKITEYLESTCTSTDKCVAVTAKDITITPASVFNEHKGSGFKIVAKIVHDIPFDLSASTFSFSFELTEIETSKVGDITITDVRILEGDSIVMEKKFNQKLSASASQFNERSAYSMKTTQAVLPLSAKIWYQYQAKSTSGAEVEITEKFNSYSISLDKVTLLNPGVEYR